MKLARLAAAAEGKPADSVEQLRTNSQLPPEFGPLPDGSRIVFDAGEAFDEVRGRRGAFVPIADMRVRDITQAELSEFEKFADFYRNQWGRMDPVVAAIKRTELSDNREQVVVDVLMSPFAQQHFDVLRQWLGTADRQQMTADSRQHGLG